MALRQLHVSTIAQVLLNPGQDWWTYWNNPPEVVSVFISASVEQAVGGNWCSMKLLDAYEEFYSSPAPGHRRLAVHFKNDGGAKGWAGVNMYWATA
jgi:hypothetical protein